MFGTLGFWEILLILLVVALLFGGRKLPELGKGLGAAIRNFKDGLKDKDIHKEGDTPKEKKDEENH